MTTDLKRRLATLETRTSLARPVQEMSDAELIAAAGLGDNPSDDELLRLIKHGERSELNMKEQSE